MLQNASSNSSTPIKLSVAWPCLRFYRWNEPMSGMNPKTWISSKQNSGSCPNRNLIQLRHTCLSETQTPLSSAIDSIPWGSKILRYWSLIGGVVRVVQPIVIEIPCYPWNYMNVSNLQRRSIPLKICFRNPVVAPIFSFNTIPRMLPLFSKCGKIQCQWNMFYFSSHDIPPQFSANGETSARWQFFGGKDLHFKTAKGLTRETLRIYIYHIYIYI